MDELEQKELMETNVKNQRVQKSLELLNEYDIGILKEITKISEQNEKICENFDDFFNKVNDMGEIYKKCLEIRNNIEREVVGVDEKIKIVNDENRKINQKMDKKNLKIKQISEYIDSSNQNIKNLMEKNESAKIQIEKLEEKNNEKFIEKQQEELFEFQRSFKNCENEKLINTEKIENLTGKLSEINLLIENLNESIQNIKKEINLKRESKNQTQNHKYHLEANKEEISNMKNACDKLRNQIFMINENETKIIQQIREISINISNQIITNNDKKIQEEIIKQTRIKSDFQALQYRKNESEKKLLEIQNEIEKNTHEFEKEKNMLLNKKLTLATTINDHQQAISKEDLEIRNATNELNEIRIKIETIKKMQMQNQKVEKENQVISKKIIGPKQINKKKCLSNPQSTILPNAIKNNSRTLQLD